MKHKELDYYGILMVCTAVSPWIHSNLWPLSSQSLIRNIGKCINKIQLICKSWFTFVHCAIYITRLVIKIKNNTNFVWVNYYHQRISGILFCCEKNHRTSRHLDVWAHIKTWRKTNSAQFVNWFHTEYYYTQELQYCFAFIQSLWYSSP